jgi:hypothetical protein
MNHMRSTILSLALAIAAFAPAVATARHGGGDAKRVAGDCSGASTAKLKVKPDGARIETEFEVDQNRNGVTWKVTMRRDGAVAVRTRATTHAPSGSFSVNRGLRNGAGSERITARATGPSGEVCTAAVSA